MVLPPLKWNWTPNLTANIFKAIAKPFGVWDCYVKFLLLLLLLLVGWLLHLLSPVKEDPRLLEGIPVQNK